MLAVRFRGLQVTYRVICAIRDYLDRKGILASRKSPLATKNLLEDTDGLRRPP